MTRITDWMRAWAVIFVCAWGGNQFSPLLVMYEQRQHYSSFMANVFLGVYVLGLAPALVIGGRLSDRHGRRPLMFGAVAAAILGSVLLACGHWGAIPLILGRLLSGVAVGIAMSVGTSWVTELSRSPFDPGAAPTAGARRAASAFFLGSGLGALVAGCLAQWGPMPDILPFFVHLAVTLPAGALLFATAETRRRDPGALPGSRRSPAIVSSATHPRFTRVVAVSAPWLFAAAAVGYGYLPTQMRATTEPNDLLFATAATVTALTASTLIQPLAKRVHSLESARGLVVALVIVAIGFALVATAIGTQSLAIALGSSVVVGAGIGIGLVSGLLEVQRIAPPQDLAGLTGVFYALAYSGFLAPAGIAALAQVAPPSATIVVVSALVLISGMVVFASSRKHLPS